MHTPPAHPIVLIIDDEIELREIIEEGLIKHGFRVVSADNVATAREKLVHSRALKETAIDIIISDIRMPAESGLDMLKSLRAAKDDVPFLLMSGHFEIDNQTAFKLGADGVFPKPFKTAAVAEKIHAVLAERSRRS